MTIFTAESFIATANTFQEYKRNLKDVRTKARKSFRFRFWTSKVKTVATNVFTVKIAIIKCDFYTKIAICEK